MSSKFVRGWGLFDSTMIVAGSMIGSGIFVVKKNGEQNERGVPANGLIL